MSISVGLNSAMRALLAQQQAMDAVAHNVANVNTPGYTRQRVILQQGGAVTANGIGGGVDFQRVERVRDLFVDMQTYTEAGVAGDFHARSASLGNVEALLGQTGPGGLQAAMDQFFNSWRDLANAPEQSAVRAGVIQAGQEFAATVNRVARSLEDARRDANNRIVTDVTEVNSLAERLAFLNVRIVETRATGNPASDLSDERDLTLTQLSNLVDVHTVQSETGSMEVFVGGRSLVSNGNFEQIDLVRNPLNGNYHDLEWRSDGDPVLVRAGEIGGLLYQRDTDIPGRIASLNALVAQIALDVNTVHALGFAQDGVTTGTAFLTGTTAATLAVAAPVVANPGLVAAATAAGSIGDGRNALAIADLQQALSMSAGSEDYGAYLNGIVTSVGVATRDAEWRATAQDMRLQQLESLRQSASGVNLDEEMVSMVQYQRGYEAAARMIRAVDEMLDSLMRLT